MPGAVHIEFCIYVSLRLCAYKIICLGSRCNYFGRSVEVVLNVEISAIRFMCVSLAAVVRKGVNFSLFFALFIYAMLDPSLFFFSVFSFPSTSLSNPPTCSSRRRAQAGEESLIRRQDGGHRTLIQLTGVSGCRWR